MIRKIEFKKKTLNQIIIHENKRSSIIVGLVVMSFNRLNSEKHIVITKDSKVEWKGFKPGGEHFGTITIKEGSLIVEGSILISGSFTMDMTSILVLDSCSSIS